MQLEFTIITPETVEDLVPYEDDIAFLGTFWPWPGFLDAIKNYLPYVCLVFDTPTGAIIGAFSIVYQKRSAEIHAVARLDAKYQFPNGSQMVPALTKIILDEIFLNQKKDKVIIKAPNDSKGARGFAIINHFTKINREKKSTVWRLTRNEYLKRLEDQPCPIIQHHKPKPLHPSSHPLTASITIPLTLQDLALDQL